MRTSSEKPEPTFFYNLDFAPKKNEKGNEILILILFIFAQKYF
jgi:hypothetical protein